MPSITMTRSGATEKDRPADFPTEGTNHQWQLCERVNEAK